MPVLHFVAFTRPIGCKSSSLLPLALCYSHFTSRRLEKMIYTLLNFYTLCHLHSLHHLYAYILPKNPAFVSVFYPVEI